MKQRQNLPQTTQATDRSHQVDAGPVVDALQALEAPGQMAQGMGNGFLAQEAQLHQAFDGPSAGLPYQSQLESVFGRDLSDVQVVDGSELLDGMGVAAVARDGAIALGGQADFDTVAHEVAHIVQFQEHGSGTGVGAPSGAAEREADQAMATARDGGTPEVVARPDGELHCRLVDQAAFLALTDSTTFDYATGEAVVEMDDATLQGCRDAARRVWAVLDEVEASNRAYEALSGLMRDGQLADAMERARDVFDQMGAACESVESLRDIGKDLTPAIDDFVAAQDDLDGEYCSLRRALWEDLQAFVDWQAQAGLYMEPGAQLFLEHAWEHGQQAQHEGTDLSVYKEVYAASTAIDVGDLDAEEEVQDLLTARREGEGQELADYHGDDAWHYLWPKGTTRPRPEEVGCRIYCNVHPSVAAAFAGQVADVLGTRGEVVEGGQSSALKVVIGEDVGRRCDSVVVYVRQLDDDVRGALHERDRILGEIARICGSAMDPECAMRLGVEGGTGTWADAMLDELPGTTLAMAPGVSTAEHPDGPSFGERVSGAVQQALGEALELGLVEDQFVQLALTRMVEAGIDPQAPWLVGPAAPDALRARVRTVEDVFDPRHGRFLYKRAIEAMEPGDRRGVQLDQASLHRLLAEMAS